MRFIYRRLLGIAMIGIGLSINIGQSQGLTFTARAFGLSDNLDALAVLIALVEMFRARPQLLPLPANSVSGVPSDSKESRHGA